MRAICNKKTLIIAIMSALFTLMLYSSVSAASFSLTEESVQVKLNGTVSISYNGGEGVVNWASNNSSIATVENGTIKGLSIGETTITATRGTETATCKVSVIYNNIQIGGNESENTTNVNLILNEHPTETLYAKVEDYNFTKITNAEVKWKSSDTSIVTVDENTGVINAVKAGETTITASAAGVTDTCKVKVLNAPNFTDFSKAKFETEIVSNNEQLKISGITPVEGGNYYYMITSTNSKPNLVLNHGNIDFEKSKIEYLNINTKENYVFTTKLANYSELNQDLYLWVIQRVSLSDWYYDTNGNYVAGAVKFVVEGEKLKKAELPALNLILQSINIGQWKSTTSNDTNNYTYIRFNFPTNTAKRKFTLKIGKVTDNSILTKIQKNDYTGITELLSYAKKSKSIYSKDLTTTSAAFYKNDNALFDGNKLLDHKGYYYIYVEFDDENGKYRPIE